MKRDENLYLRLGVLGFGLTFLPIGVCLVLVALVRSDLIALDPPTMNVIALWAGLPVSLLGIALFAAGLHFARGERESLLRDFERYLKKREIELGGLPVLFGDFNNIQRGDYDYVVVYPSLLRRLRRRIKPGLRVHLTDGDYESEGILEVVEREWRARILWETARDIEDEEQGV